MLNTAQQIWRGIRWILNEVLVLFFSFTRAFVFYLTAWLLFIRLSSETAVEFYDLAYLATSSDPLRAIAFTAFIAAALTHIITSRKRGVHNGLLSGDKATQAGRTRL